MGGLGGGSGRKVKLSVISVAVEMEAMTTEDLSKRRDAQDEGGDQVLNPGGQPWVTGVVEDVQLFMEMHLCLSE